MVPLYEGTTDLCQTSKLSLFRVSSAINLAWRSSTKLVQWINFAAHKSLCFFMSVWCSSIHLDPSMKQTAVRTQRPRLASHFPLSLASPERNLRNPGAQSAHQQPKRHAAFKIKTNLWHINRTNWSQMLLLRTKYGIKQNKTKVIDNDVWIWAGGRCLHDNKVNHWLTANRYIFMF